MNHNLTYMRKIHKCIVRNCEIVINPNYREASIYYYDKKLEKVIEFLIDYNLARDIIALPFMQFDSGNWDTNTRVYRIDYETIRENDIKGVNSSKIFAEVLKKYDVSYKPLNLKDFK